MLKRKALSKIIISLSCLAILGILYIFPDKNESIKPSISKSNDDNNIIYLIDDNNYISRVSTILTSTTNEEKVKEIISFLTIGSNKYIR